LYAYLVEEQV